MIRFTLLAFAVLLAACSSYTAPSARPTLLIINPVYQYGFQVTVSDNAGHQQATHFVPSGTTWCVLDPPAVTVVTYTAGAPGITYSSQPLALAGRPNWSFSLGTGVLAPASACS